jgi:hypothetical protein
VAFGEGCRYINERQITIADYWKRKHKYRQSILGISSNTHGKLGIILGITAIVWTTGKYPRH